MLKLESLAYFLTLAETRHFGEAAERLFITQQALSKSIKQLEARLGVALFQGRAQALTPAGQQLQLRARLLFNQLEALEAPLFAPLAQPKQTLRIRYAVLSQQPVMIWIKRYLRAYPDLQIQLDSADATAEQQLLEQTIDCVFGLTKPVSEQLSWHLIDDTPFVCVISPQSEPRDWDAVPYIAYAQQSPFQDCQALFHPAELSARPLSAEADIASAIQLCLAGVGALYLPRKFVTRELVEQRLSVLPTPFEHQFRSYMLWNPAAQSELVAPFVSDIISYLDDDKLV